MRALTFLSSCALVAAAGIAACGSPIEIIHGNTGGGATTSTATGAGGTTGTGGGGFHFDAGPDDAGDASDGNDAAPPAVCGDGVISEGEQCDDGNATPGDGCSGICQIEPGYTCPMPGMPCIYTVTQVCGNGNIEGNEQCDDGNADDADGCSSACQVEPGWACTVPGQPCEPAVMPKCGDGQVNSGEQCDDGNADGGDGCSATCQIEQGFTCPTPGMPCQELHFCGDGVVDANEQCDDGNAMPGDGCSGLCLLDTGYACPTPGQPCVNIFVCGNAHVDPGEACDDGNTSGGDGCSADCSLVEAGYTCPNVGGNGGPCTPVPNMCGDGVLAGFEQCDDGNTNNGDGCSSTCQVEAGYTCPAPGMACTKIAFCGDGLVSLAIGEQCDDGNAASGDGCSATCTLEPNYVCPTPGQPCITTVVCGDGKVGGAETCDDKNAVSGDGCTAQCQVENGWQCPTPGAKCIAKKCGDGILAGNEQCDDGNNANGDGCSATCTLEPGFACVSTGTPPKSVCHVTKCGDGVKEGFEQCDDGNLIPYDGCSPTCTKEPQCQGGTCTAVCGDGLKFPQEECDDGNTIAGDGCSPTCKIEPGWVCPAVNQPPPAQLAIPVLYRDFLYNGTSSPGTGHPDFERFSGNGPQLGLVQSSLGADGEPVWKSNTAAAGSADPGSTQLTGAVNFCWWYHEKGCNGAASTNPYSKLVYLDASSNPTTLTLAQISTNVYQYSTQNFYPIDNLGWNAGGSPQVTSSCGNTHNYAFTSELHYAFTYSASSSPKFDFTGDDDVWAFINGKLAVDLGGLHPPASGSITLTPAVAATLGLVDGGMYSIDLFQAERHTCGSTYTLTLSGFTHTVSQCHTVCGDGIVAGNEVCDDGVNDGAYGGCMPGCLARGPFCGDGAPQTPPEACDDGTNSTTYGGAKKVCGPGCAYAPYCGDGVVSNGEQCDEGAMNGSGYGHCAGGCVLGPRCGDGLVQATDGEECDDGVNNGSTGSKCKLDCKLKCGDGVPDPGEQCDLGKTSNVGGYGGCNPDCTLGPRCGDGIKNGAEQCDDGKNDGSYGTCNANCTVAGYCGDNTVQTPWETCDMGAANSSTAYGMGMCTNHCTPAPYCGDKAVDGQFGEVCDDGVNSGLPGSCAPDCKSFIALVTCGNGVINAPEQCDDGANNGTPTSACDTHCRIKCGNGLKDPGEQCDDGKNDGSYGTCAPGCHLAAYCGDGIKNGPETCDNGANNQPLASAYGPGICTTTCKFAPYCGDGRVDTAFGEQCDGGPGCDANCKISGPH